MTWRDHATHSSTSYYSFIITLHVMPKSPSHIVCLSTWHVEMILIIHQNHTTHLSTWHGEMSTLHVMPNSPRHIDKWLASRCWMSSINSPCHVAKQQYNKWRVEHSAWNAQISKSYCLFVNMTWRVGKCALLHSSEDSEDALSLQVIFRKRGQ